MANVYRILRIIYNVNSLLGSQKNFSKFKTLSSDIIKPSSSNFCCIYNRLGKWFLPERTPNLLTTLCAGKLCLIDWLLNTQPTVLELLLAPKYLAMAP